MGIDLHVVDPFAGEAVWAMQQYFDEIDERFAQGFDPGDALTTGLGTMAAPDGAFVVARRGDETVGCGGVQTIGDGIGEIKRMWVSGDARGHGLGKRLLQRLEDESRRLGHHAVRLDTNSQLPEAVAMYRAAGYVEIDRYNDNPYPDHFFEKRFVTDGGS
jgi:GNAT superfamily N-acetyltransferase